MSAAPGEGPRAERIPAIALLLAASVLLSRVLGYGREMLIAYRLGTSAEADAYRAAFQLPDMLNSFLAGGALSLAFVPLYLQRRNAEGAEVADRFFACVLGTMTLLASAVALGLAWWAEELVALQFGGFDAATQARTVQLTRIVLPAQVFFVAGGILRAGLMAHDRFATQALAPLFYNAGIIAAGLGFGATLGAEALVWGALAGAALGAFAAPLLELLRGPGPRLGFRVAPWSRDFGRYLWLAAPLMCSFTLFTVDEWYERIFGSRSAEGVVAQLAYARQLVLAPVGVIGQALATAALPALAQLHGQGRTGELNRVLTQTLRGACALALLSLGALVALAEPLVGMLFERGAFGPADTRAVAALLRLLAFAVPALVAQQIMARAFFARGDMWRPMLIGSALALLALPLYMQLGARFGGAGLALAGAMGMSASAAATLVLLRRVHGAEAAGPLLRDAMPAASAALGAALAAHFALAALDLPHLAALLVGALIYGLLASGIALALGDGTLHEVALRLRRRLVR